MKKLLVYILLIIVVSEYSANGQDSLQLTGSIGKFTNAVSISSSREEFIFVSDIAENKIYKLDIDGSEVASFGGTGLGNNELNQPYSVDASNGLDVLVADFQNNRIKRLDYSLNFLLSFDFNSYNLTAESTKKIYNPKSILTLSSGEIFVLCDASNYKASKINDYNDVSILFGSNSIGAERLENPVKMVKGNQLDLWILDKGTNEIVNFTNFGVFSRKIKSKFDEAILSVCNFNNNLYILYESGLLIYDLKRGQYTESYYKYPYIKNITDITVFDKNTVLFLSKNMAHKFRIR
ncbi:MAG: hypothetical protein K8I03_07125 [Ignavibacteria bacterium]|nr:hypothetical protein [Ignavibacteria bacterium]